LFWSNNALIYQTLSLIATTVVNESILLFERSFRISEKEFAGKDKEFLIFFF
jgi:hypothetical protein